MKTYLLSLLAFLQIYAESVNLILLLLWLTTSGGEVLVVLTTNTLKPQELTVCHWKGLSLQTFHANGVVCKPARSALMTGHYQHLSGCDVVVNANPNNPDHDLGIIDEEWTFAEAMKSTG